MKLLRHLPQNCFVALLTFSTRVFMFQLCQSSITGNLSCDFPSPLCLLASVGTNQNFQENHSFSFAAHYPHGITSAIYHPGHR